MYQFNRISFVDTPEVFEISSGIFLTEVLLTIPPIIHGDDVSMRIQCGEETNPQASCLLKRIFVDLDY